MAAKKSEDKGEEKKKSPLKLVVILLAVLLVAAGAYMFLGRGSAAPAAGEPVAAAPVIEGKVMKLDPLFINLKDARFLKLGIALQTSLMGEKAELDGSKALDAAIEVFSGQDILLLSDPEGRSKLKEDLLERITDSYGSEVSEIYFTEFVMQ